MNGSIYWGEVNTTKREDSYIVDVSGNVGAVKLDSKEQHTSFSGGPRWYFMYVSENLRPFVGARLGLSFISQDYVDNDFNSSGFFLAPEAGLDFSVSDDFSLSLRFDYELHPTRKFRLDGGKEDADSFEGYTSEANYSHYKLILGFTYYL